jgi:hypothetical protein
MKFLSLVLALIFAQTANPPKYDPSQLSQDKGATWNTSGTTSSTFVLTEPSFLVIDGPDGDMLVQISLKDGAVTYGKNYKPDAAAKAFWDAIPKNYKCPPVAPQGK